ncbi:MAG: glycosyltransferase family 4 protein [Bacteroidota bacterium]
MENGNTKMRVAIILTALVKQGSITVFKELVHHLSKKEFLVIDLYYFDSNVEITVDCPVQQISFKDKLPRYDYDVVHSTGLRPDIFIYLNKKRFPSKTKFLTTIHSFIRKDLTNEYNSVVSFFASFFWYKILKAQDVVVVLTESAQTYYTKYLSSELVVVNNGRTVIHDYKTPDEDVEKLTKLAKRYKLIGTHAKITNIKSLDTVINALPLLPSYAFVIIGKGRDVDKLINLSERIGVSDRCLFLGFRSNILPYFQYYDLYTMPSLSEGLPMALIEAVANKVPCLCSDIDTFRELFNDQEVLKFKVQDSNDYAQKVMLLSDKEISNNFAKRAFDTYTKSYTGEVMTDNYVRLYERLIMNSTN